MVFLKSGGALLDFLGGQDDSIVLGLEPLHGVLLVETMGTSDTASLAAPVSDVLAGTAEHNIEVHTVDTNAGIVLDSQVNVLLDSKSKVSFGGEVLLPELVLLDFESSLQDLLSLGSPDSAVDGDLLIPSDAEGADSVPSLGEHGSLPSKRFQHLSSASESVTRLSHTD